MKIGWSVVIQVIYDAIIISKIKGSIYDNYVTGYAKTIPNRIFGISRITNLKH